MTKISKKPKRPATPLAKVNALILAIQDAPQDELAAILSAVQVWHWPRTDLHYWIKPLNRFDSILDEICKNYNVVDNTIQVNEFTPRTKELILAILRFTRLLLDNATNRKLYSSFDRMNDLLLTQDLDVLESVLRLIFRRAQQIAANGQLHSADTFNLTANRIKDLTSGWNAVRQAGLTMLDWVREDLGSKQMPKDILEVDFRFYRKAATEGETTKIASKEQHEKEASASTSVSTPSINRTTSSRMSRTVPASAPVTPAKGAEISDTSDLASEGLANIHLGVVAEQGQSAPSLVADAVEMHRLPSEEKLHLLQRIRVSMAAPHVDSRQQMLRIRLLAIAVLVHTTAHSVAESTIFLFEPDFIAQLADLVHPDSQVPISIRTVALLTLDTVSRIRNKVGEVTSSLSVSVNHGTLMSILRRLPSDLQAENTEANAEYTDALFNFLMHLQTTGYAGNMLLGAGVIPLLIELTKEMKDTPDSLLVANRSVTFLDNFTYSFANASNPFASAGGLGIFVERVHKLVLNGVQLDQSRIDSSGADQDGDILSFPESTLLKSLFRCLQRLMSSGGSQEGVRNLIDSSLVQSCKLVMQHRRVFGPQNLALAINIMLTFVHNEPTSLGILQEGKVPDTFYDAVQEGDIEPSLDVLSAIPTAIGALCLNEAGLKQFFDTRLSIIDKFFEIFQSEKHARVLNDRENAVVVGANFDELVRHHPKLKEPVFRAITKLLDDLYQKGQEVQPKNPEGYRLMQVETLQSATTSANLAQAQREEAGDIAMADETAPANSSSPSEADPRKEDNQMLTFIAITGRFLEGFFSTPSHCKEYIKKDGLDPLLRLFTLPCIPYDINQQSPYPGLTTVFLTLNEHSSAPLLKALLAHARAALTEIKDFWHFAPSDESPFDTAAVQARIDEMLSPGTAEALTSANEVFRRLVKSQLILAILSELYSMDTYMSRQPSTQLLANLKNADDSKLIHDFCAIYRACILSHVCLKAQLPESSKAKSLLTPIVAQVEASSMETDSGPSSTQSPQTVAPEGTSSDPEKDKAVDWPENKLKNAKALKQVFTAIPEAIKTFLQGVMTIHNSRRSAIDTQQRKDATYIANAIALGVAQNLRWPSTPKASVNFEYSTLMAKFMADLLTSERSSVAGLHLIFLKALDKHQGILRLIDLLGRYAEEAAELTLIPEADRDSGARLRLIHAVGGLKVVLGVLDTITGHKTLLSPGHLLLLTQDSKSPSFFDPNAFLVKLRARVLPAVNGIWKSDFLGPSPPIIVRAVFRIILHILESQGENSETVSTTPFPTGLPSRVQAQPNQEHVTSLMEMGFPRQACEQALIRRMNNLATAADYLMSHPDVVAAARTREAAQTAAAAAAAPAPTTPMGEPASEAIGEPTSADAQSSTPLVPATALEVDMTDHAGDVPEVTASIMEEGAADSTEAATSDKGKEPAKRYSKADLDIQRDAVKSSFIDRSLTLSQDHGELVFDIRDALKTIEFKNSSGIYDASRGLEGILQALNALIQNSGDSLLAREKGIAVRVRLVALIFSDPSFRRAADAIHEKYMAPVDILVQEYFQGSYTAETRPKWLASIMLLAEMILARSELPYDPRVAANLTMDEDEDFTADVSKQPVLRGPAFSESRETLFEVCLHVLQNGLKDRAEFQSAMRLIIFLTRRFEVARKFVERGGLKALMSTYDGNHKSDNNFQLFALLILRHSVEDKEILKSLMSLHIGSWLSKAAHRNNADVGSFGRDLVADAYRDTDAFMEVTQELCQLGDGPIGEIMTKRKAEQPAQEATVEDKATEVPVKDDEEMTVEDPGKMLSKPLTASPEIENVLHFLIEQAHSATAQLLSPSRTSVATGTEAQAPQNTPATAAELAPLSDTASAVPAKDVAKAGVPPSIKEYTYASFYLTCLYELVTSYMPCKYALLSYKRKGNELASGTPGPSTASKAGKGRFFLGYLLSDVIPTNSLVPDATSESRKRFALSSQAVGVLIALCSEVQRKSSDTKEEPSPEITLVRKTVLDALAKAFKDAASIPESMNAKYGRLSSLSSLCSRLLAPPVPPGGPTMTTAERSHTDLSIQMAKLMLEKNFAALLTNSLSDIDLNYPSVQVLINAILSPLELLTKLVTKISRTVDGDSGSIAQAPQPEPVMLEEDSASEEGDMEEADMDMEEDGNVDIQGEGDETMDVYRNSALGMFEGQLEPANAEEQYMSSEEVEEEMEEWGNEDDLMDEEGVVPSDVSDESDMDEDDEMAMAHEMRDAMEGADDMNDSSSDNSEDDDDDDMDNDDEDGFEIGEEIDDGGDAHTGREIQAELAAALRNGQLEPVDDFTGQMLANEMDMLGEPDMGGMVRIEFGDEGAPPIDDGDLEGNDGPEDEEQGVIIDDEDEDDEPSDELDQHNVPGDIHGMFQDLLGAGGEGNDLRLSIQEDPAGERVLSIGLGGGPLGAARRSTAQRPAQPPALGQHSLLVDNSDAGRNRAGREAFAGSSRQRHRGGARPGSDYQEWVQSLEDMIGTGAGQLLQQVFGNTQGHGAAVPATIVAGAGQGAGPGPGLAILQNLLSGMERHQDRPERASRHRAPNAEAAGNNPGAFEAQLINEAIVNPTLTPLPTVSRWTEESTIFGGGMSSSERISLLSKRVAAMLRPEKERKQEEARQKSLAEQQEASAGWEGAQQGQDPAGAKMEEDTKPALQDAPSREATLAAPQADLHFSESASPQAEGSSTTPATPQTPASQQPGASTSERPSWRERLERRRQAQGNAPSTSQTPSSANARSALPTQEDLTEVMNLAARLSAVAPAPVAPGILSATSSQIASSINDAVLSDDSAPNESRSEDVQMEGTEEADFTENPVAVEREATAAPTPDQAEQEPQSGPSNNVPRVTIEIHGSTVDITDTGIDPTFLEALPDDMREEVLNQHFRETRAAAAPNTNAAAAPTASTDINAEFLDALPPELRAEVLAQEAVERARQQRMQAATQAQDDAAPGNAGPAGNGVPGGAAGGMLELDPATFLATLDPELRQTVLLDQGEEMLGALPPDLLAEYEALRDREIRAHRALRARGGPGSLRQQLFGGRPQTVPAKKVVQKREAVQLLDKAGVTTLVRLLFFPPPLKKSALQNILIHLCENGRTRVELINLLLGILYDGTKDAGGGAIVDRTFSQMSLSKTGKLLSKGKGPSTPAATPSAVPVTPGSNPYAAAALSAAPSGDAVPHLPVQRSLEALAYLVAANDASAAYFLTEQDLTINLAKDGPGKKAPGTGRKEKGKGKERENSQSKEKNYPIVVLLALLDRESLTKSPSIMEALTKLLAHITVPLRQLDQEATPNSEMTVTPSQSAGDVQTTVSTSQPASASITSSASLLPLEIPPDNIQEAEKKEDKKEDPRLVKSAPRLPATYVKMVVNILDLGECSSKMFSAALSLIHNLWYLPEARDIISSELIVLAQRYGKDLIEDLGELESILARGETATSSSTLGKFSQASSKQAKILRVLKTLEHAKQQQAKMLRKKKAELEAKQKEEEERKKAEEVTKEPKDGASTAIGGTTEKKPADALAVQVPSVEEVSVLNKVDELYNGFDFSPLWTKLSDCLTVIEKNDDVSNAGTLLPLIEAFLLVSSWGLEKPDGTLGTAETPAMPPNTARNASMSPTTMTRIVI